jgi:hypothetical protein
MMCGGSWGGDAMIGARRAAALVLLVGVARPAIATAQGRWDLSLGAFDGRGDDVSSRGAVGTFTRWRGPERAFQWGGPRLAVIWSAQDQSTIQPKPSYPFRVTGKRAMWAVAVGVPFRAALHGRPLRPFVDVGPGVSMYRSVDQTRFTDTTNGHVSVINRTRWLFGPSVDLAVGLQVPGNNRGPRLHVRGAIRAGWLLGSEAVGADPKGVWHVWELTGGAGFPF